MTPEERIAARAHTVALRLQGRPGRKHPRPLVPVPDPVHPWAVEARELLAELVGRGFSQRHVAAAIGVHWRTLDWWRRGNVPKRPNLERLREASEAARQGLLCPRRLVVGNGWRRYSFTARPEYRRGRLLRLRQAARLLADLRNRRGFLLVHVAEETGNSTERMARWVSRAYAPTPDALVRLEHFYGRVLRGEVRPRAAKPWGGQNAAPEAEMVRLAVEWEDTRDPFKAIARRHGRSPWLVKKAVRLHADPTRAPITRDERVQSVRRRAEGTRRVARIRENDPGGSMLKIPNTHSGRRSTPAPRD